jgi:hypothetical protein
MTTQIELLRLLVNDSRLTFEQLRTVGDARTLFERLTLGRLASGPRGYERRAAFPTSAPKSGQAVNHQW